MNRGRPADEHRHFEEMAVAHVLGGLDEDDGRVFRSHLLECPNCRARVGELRALAHDLADVERDERRLRAAKAVETKPRKQDDGGDGKPRQRARSRLVPVMVIGAVVSLGAWNFTLRGNLERLESALDSSMAAAAVLEFGMPGEVVREADGVRGQVKAEQGTMVVLIDGLDDERPYGLYVRTEGGEVVYRRFVESTRGRLFVMIPQVEDGATLLVTRPQGAPTAEPSGLTMFETRLPPTSGG